MIWLFVLYCISIIPAIIILSWFFELDPREGICIFIGAMFGILWPVLVLMLIVRSIFFLPVYIGSKIGSWQIVKK